MSIKLVEPTTEMIEWLLTNEPDISSWDAYIAGEHRPRLLVYYSYPAHGLLYVYGEHAFVWEYTNVVCSPIMLNELADYLVSIGVQFDESTIGSLLSSPHV